MRNIMSKTYFTAIVLAGLGLASTPVMAKSNPEVYAPATEHQSETLKKVPDQAEESFTSSKKKAVFTAEPINNDRNVPATIHQEQAIAGYDDDSKEDDSKQVH